MVGQTAPTEFKPLFPACSDECYVPIRFGDPTPCKYWVPALIDSGSFASLINVRCANDLNLEYRPTQQTVRGIGGASNQAVGELVADIQIGKESFWPDVKMFVLPESSMTIPIILGRRPMNERCFEIRQDLKDRTISFKNQSQDWACVSYVNNPKREVFSRTSELE